MGTELAGKFTIAVSIENLEDVFAAHHGELPTDGIRRLTVPDATVDSGVMGLMMPTRLIRSLGLRPRPVVTWTTRRYEAIRLTIQGRDCVTDVHEIADGQPILVGRIPLVALDWVVDPVGRRLVGNPFHGGEHMIDAL